MERLPQILNPIYFSILNIILLLFLNINIHAQRNVIELKDWKFHKGDVPDAASKDFNENSWKSVSIPHDWAIKGPFDKDIDKQIIRIEQNNEILASEKTGRTGSLPFIGIGWYRTHFTIPAGHSEQQVIITFDGAMSNAEVFINGVKAGERPYGYSYFYFDITELIDYNNDNTIAVRLENLPLSSRWYPGAGLYRKVNLIVKDQIHFKHWGHFIRTPNINENKAQVQITSEFSGESVNMETIIWDPQGEIVARNLMTDLQNNKVEQSLNIQKPVLWSPESPALYSAEFKLYNGEIQTDSETIPFGIRNIQYIPDKGFELNGVPTKFKGVCLHHDLGPLGIAVNKAALERQLKILKDLGCNAIRSAHNMPSMEQLELCDEMGFLFLAESFDEWKKPKVQNGYNLYFDEWAEKDIMNLVHATRNHPCIVMWSAGNEVPDQWGPEGIKRAHKLQDIFHREDPGRPVTMGMDQVEAVMENGFAEIWDIPGLNYRVHLYEEAYLKFPQRFLLGSETASTVSSRGVYKFPAVEGIEKTYDDLQCSSYDLEYCSWSNLPEDDFIMQDNKSWVMGEFVWTGFDYLGEPTPYDSYWPSRSSYFGICDLAGLPKDRYYLYRSRWNKNDETLHILPHWNWKGREGETTPVFVYTSYPGAELFVNGKSQGIRMKNDSSKLSQYRLMWNDVIYEPGEIKVVAINKNGQSTTTKSVFTAGKPYGIQLEADKDTLTANGEDLSFITASIVDKNGYLCPTANLQLYFDVKGAGTYRAACNGDATSLELFHQPTMQTFNGKLVIIVQSSDKEGNILLRVSGQELITSQIEIFSKNME